MGGFFRSSCFFLFRLHFFKFCTRNRPFFWVVVSIYISLSRHLFDSDFLFFSSYCWFFTTSVLNIFLAMLFIGVFKSVAILLLLAPKHPNRFKFVNEKKNENEAKRKTFSNHRSILSYWIPDKIYTIFQSSMLIENCQ